MRNSDMKIRKIINENFDARLEKAIMSYIIETGIEDLKKMTDEEIDNLEGNGFMTKEFCQAYIKTAIKISKECSVHEIMTYVKRIM